MQVKISWLSKLIDSLFEFHVGSKNSASLAPDIKEPNNFSQSMQYLDTLYHLEVILYRFKKCSKFWNQSFFFCCNLNVSANLFINLLGTYFVVSPIWEVLLLFFHIVRVVLKSYWPDPFPKISVNEESLEFWWIPFLVGQRTFQQPIL